MFIGSMVATVIILYITGKFWVQKSNKANLILLLIYLGIAVAMRYVLFEREVAFRDWPLFDLFRGIIVGGALSIVRSINFPASKKTN